MKKCSKCAVVKKHSEFKKDRTKNDGYYNSCRDCVKIQRRTKLGLITDMYAHTRSRSREKAHKKLEYSKEEFKKWLFHSTDFDHIYNEWVLSGYHKDKTPSVDRINNHKGYFFDNIQLVDWKTNHTNASLSVRRGEVGSHIPVSQYTIEGVFIRKYFSANEAFKVTGSSHISCCCKGNRSMSGGFKWEYSQ